MGHVVGEPWRPQDVDLGSPGRGGSVGLGVSWALAPPAHWEDLGLGFPSLGLGFEGSRGGFWGSPGHILGCQGGFCGGLRGPGWIREFQHPQCKVQGRGTVGQTPHGHHTDVRPQKLGEGPQNNPPVGCCCMQLLGGYLPPFTTSHPSPKVGCTLDTPLKLGGCHSPNLSNCTHSPTPNHHFRGYSTH